MPWGRQHAPCRGCSQPAQDTDDDFPQYNTFNSDSIGVFGFDPTANTVFNPASSLDFMTAFVTPSAWISPYTHQALLGPVQGGPSPERWHDTLAGTQDDPLFAIGTSCVSARYTGRSPSAIPLPRGVAAARPDSATNCWTPRAGCWTAGRWGARARDRSAHAGPGGSARRSRGPTASTG